ncbi:MULTISPECIES: MarR family EPS-associated transcriptional regulator [Arcobacteraceae]|uniref:MarR family EPS-associated transcriptional regulator n=1 Tax=Arcobacter porcinus TaxID=1935204 RepID=A0ABX2Y9Z0_9BACT|nr:MULTISPECIES: MarR family EPS-associated transcriptional regulator [Arcobacteraceae]OCL89609.1 hypothetical protein AAX28_02021 [Arcobacter porcinus]
MNQEEIELQVLRSVDKVTSQRTIADEIGYSLGKVNYVLKNLIDKGLIKTQRFVNSENKIQYKYLLTPKGIKEKIEITEKFIAIKKAEYDELQKELEILKKVGSEPTYAKDLAKTILDIIPQIENSKVEIYNYSNEGVLS